MWRLLLIVLFGAGIVGTIYANFWLLNEPYPTSAIATDTKTNGSQTTDSESGAEAEFQLALKRSVHTLSRPLFDPTRRPFTIKPKEKKPVAAVKKTAPIVAKPVERLALSLMGTSANPQHRKALIAVEGGDAAWISEGEDINEWSVLSVDGDGIVLKNGDRTEAYFLFPENDVGQTE